MDNVEHTETGASTSLSSARIFLTAHAIRLVATLFYPWHCLDGLVAAIRQFRSIITRESRRLVRADDAACVMVPQ